MNKKLVKIFIVFLNILIISSIFSNILLAANVTDFSGKKDLLEKAGTDNAVVNILGTILEIIRIIAVAVAFTILVIIGCKYLIASAGDRADIKKYALNYIIGAVILFGASAILGIAKNFTDAALGD